MRGLMSIFILSCCLFSSNLSSPVFLAYQDSLGQYSFGYSAPGSARSEVRTLNGATRGTYSYIDQSGKIQSAEYVADGENGFQVIATNLPQPPLPVKETPEVMAARIAHLEAHRIAVLRNNQLLPKIGAIEERTSSKAKDILAENSANTNLLPSAESSSVAENETEILEFAENAKGIARKTVEASKKMPISEGSSQRNKGYEQLGLNDSTDDVKPAIVPVSIVPIGSSSYIDYVVPPAVHYVEYDIL